MRGCRVGEQGWGAPLGWVCKTRLGTGAGPVLGTLWGRGWYRDGPLGVCVLRD